MILALATWLAGLAVYAWFATWTGFYVVAGYERARALNVRVPIGGHVVAILWYAVGAPGDAVYNAIIGSIRFREAPKWREGEWMYSGRVQRLVNRNDTRDWRYRLAFRWAEVLNAIAPGHITLPA